MKRLSYILPVLLAAVLVLAACSGGGQDSNATQGAGLPTSAGGPGTGLETQESPELTETMPALDGTAAATEPAVGTPQTTQAVDSTAAVPEDVMGTAAPATGEATAVNGTPVGTPAGTGLNGTQTPGATAGSETPLATAEVTEPSSTEVMTDTLRGATITPEDARRFMILLSNWDGFSLVDSSGQVFGTVDDYIINLCEAHILYMVVSGESGQILVPYEVVSVNGGTIDAEAGAINVNFAADQLGGAPTQEALPDLAVADWETGVRDYWSGIASLSSLTTGCNVAATATQVAPDGSNQEGTTVTKLVYASQLRGAVLQDGNGTLLGRVKDAVVEPESGQLFYLAVALEGVQAQTGAGQGAVLVPIGAVNLADGAQAEEGSVALVLLVDNEVLQNAPAIANIGDLTTNVNEEAHSYWSQYVQMGPGPTNEATTP